MSDYASNSIYQAYKIVADKINWKEININDLFKLQIEHENDDLGEIYFAALVCRTFGYAGRIYSQCQRHVPFEECHDCIIDALKYVLDKRVWENPNSTIYLDKTGPDKAFHIAMKRQKGIMLSRYNAYRRKSNFNTLSLDDIKEDYNDAGEGWLVDNSDTIATEALKIIISEYFSNTSDYIDGLFLDIICNEKYNVFLEKNIISSLRNLDMAEYNHCKEMYGADRTIYIKTLNMIKESSNKFLYIKLKQLLYKLRKDFIND